MGPVVLDSPWLGETFTPPTALDIETIEATVVNRLSAQISGIEIAHFPDQPEAYRMTHRIGAAFVRYEGAEYGKLIDTAAIVQERTLKFDVMVLMRDLAWSLGGGAAGGGTPGAYAIIEAVRAALTGFRVPACEKTYPLRERFLKRDKQGGVWIYAITFAMRTVAVEPSTSNDYPLLTRARAQEQGHITAVGAAPMVYTFDSNGQIQLPQGNVSALEVTNPATGANYIIGTDYTVDAVNGIVSRVPSGAIAPGTPVAIGYTYADIVTAIANGGSAPTAPTN
jgi:Gp37 protein